MCRVEHPARPGSGVVAVLAVASLLFFSAACRGVEVPADRPGASTSQPLDAAGDITLTGDVTRSLGSYVVQLGAGSPEPVIVVFRSPTHFPDGARLEVRGRITTFSAADLERKLQVELGPEVDALEGLDCLVTTSVRTLSSG